MRALLAGILVCGLSSSSAFAQSSSWNDLPDRFRIDTGYFRISANTVLRLDGPAGGGDVDFENDLGVDQDADTYWLNGIWRVGRRHQLELSYTSLNRERSDHTLERDFVWGGETYTAGLSASTSTGSDILGGYYRFAAYRNDRFEIGPTIGVGYLWLEATVRATGSVTGPGGAPVTRTLERSATTGSITGAVGGYAAAWPAKRLVLRADYLYIKVKPEDAEASVTDWRLGANYYITRHVGVGAQYKYNQYRYDRQAFASELGGEITFEGFQAFLSFLF